VNFLSAIVENRVFLFSVFFFKFFNWLMAHFVLKHSSMCAATGRMRNAGVAIVGDLFVRLNTCNAMPTASAQYLH